MSRFFLVAIVVLTSCVLLMELTATTAGTIAVTSLADSGVGSLRQALIGANDGDTITFNVPR